MTVEASDGEFPIPDWPLFGLTSDVRAAIAKARSDHQSCVLATLYAAEGGAPRGIGAQMVVTSRSVCGYLSGGCVEADVVRHAGDVLKDKQPRWLVYGKGGPIDIRLPCGGRIEVLLEFLPPDDAAAGALMTMTDNRQPALWVSDGLTRSCLRDDVGFRETAGCRGEAVTMAFAPRHRLAVVGHDPVALALASLSLQADMETHLVRPKGPSAAPPLVGVRYWRTSPGEAFAAMGLDPWTAVAVATHQDEDDHDALIAALPSDAGYVGLLGSRRRLAGKRARLLAVGISSSALSRLKAPIGIPISGNTPWDIAIGIVAEVRQVLNGAQRCSLRPLHALNAA